MLKATSLKELRLACRDFSPVGMTKREAEKLSRKEAIDFLTDQVGYFRKDPDTQKLIKQVLGIK